MQIDKNHFRSSCTANLMLIYSQKEQSIYNHSQLLQIKIAKCFQHGNVRNYQSQTPNQTKSKRIIEAPSIQGSMKIFSLRVKTSRVHVNYKPQTSRPKTTNTIIRSRTSEPRIQRKLQMFSKEPTQGQDQQFRPSILTSKMFRGASGNSIVEDGNSR